MPFDYIALALIVHVKGSYYAAWRIKLHVKCLVDFSDPAGLIIQASGNIQCG